MGSDDCQTLAAYPLQTTQHYFRFHICNSCQIRSVRWMVVNSVVSPADPDHYCDICFKMLHYNSKGEKICDFKAYRYNDILQSTLSSNLHVSSHWFNDEQADKGRCYAVSKVSMRPWQTIQETNHNPETQYFSCCVLQVDSVSVKQQLHISHKMPESEQICDHSLMNCLFLYMLQVISHMQSFMYMSGFFLFCFLSIFLAQSVFWYRRKHCHVSCLQYIFVLHRHKMV